MARRVVISYWVLPIISGLVWFGTLLGMLLSWVIDEHGRRYPNMKSDIAFISSIGADRLSPLFITGCVLTSVFLDLSFIAERWLRHRGRLIPNSSVGEKILAYLTIVFALLGTVGLICLSIFDSRRHKHLHNTFLLLFIVGYMISAIFICWEYQRLKIKHRDYKMLRISFWVKLGFIIVELSLCVIFAACGLTKTRDAAAILEWIISFIFTFYVFSFVIDLYPALRTKNPEARFPKPTARDTDRDDSVSNESHHDPTRPNMEAV